VYQVKLVLQVHQQLLAQQVVQVDQVHPLVLVVLVLLELVVLQVQ
jgi:hypothetical protein